MERASKLIRGLRLSGDVLSAGDLACAAWPQAVGQRIAAHTRACRMVRTRLIVEVEDYIWQRQLFALTPHILNNLKKSFGPAWWKTSSFASCRGGASRSAPRRRFPPSSPTRPTALTTR